MANLEFTRDFSVPPNEVFVFFVPQRMPLWYGVEMESHFEVQGGASDFSAGQKVQITGKLGNCEVSLTVVITAYRWESAARVAIPGFVRRARITAMGTRKLANAARVYVCATPTKCPDYSVASSTLSSRVSPSRNAIAPGSIVSSAWLSAASILFVSISSIAPDIAFARVGAAIP